MNVNQIILRNLKKNIKNYYLYVFALLFSVSLYFSFVTLQYDPSMDATKASIKGGAAVRTASILLVAIVSIFLFYANTIFIKRRSKEIGLFQLIGMTKNRIFRIISIENAILYFSSLFIGILIGFIFSKLIVMILFKITDVQAIAKLHFSSEALAQTVLVFLVIYLFIMLINFTFIKKQTILSLFRVTSSSETKVKRVSFWEMLLGLIGILAIATGYYISSKLFDGDFTEMTELFIAMTIILASVIIGTYLFYKGSVTFLSNIIRKRKKGYLNINEVLSLSTIMFRMKSNALLLTIITTVSALAIGLLSLSYISYYSAEQSAKEGVPDAFSFVSSQDANLFKQALDDENVTYEVKQISIVQVDVNVGEILSAKPEGLNMDPNQMTLGVVSEKSINGVDLSEDEVLFTGYSEVLQKFMSFKDSGIVKLLTKNETISLNYMGLDKPTVVSYIFSSGGLPTAIVDDTIFDQLQKNVDESIQSEYSLYLGVDVKNDENEKANAIFHENELNSKNNNISRLDMIQNQRANMGLIMFIVGFLGLAFLITSGCILYFKQMDESEDEKYNYTILRKLGYTQGDLLKGIQGKQLFNFGIPLLIGLLHSYFAIQSGYFFFGTELWAPMIIVMALYTVLYSIFGLLSVVYYKKVIKAAL